MDPPSEFKPVLKVEVSSGKKLLDETEKLKIFEEVGSEMRKVHPLSKEMFKDLIIKHRGNISRIAAEAKVSWSTARKWLKHYNLVVFAGKQQEVFEQETTDRIVGEQVVDRDSLTLAMVNDLAAAGVRHKYLAERFGYKDVDGYRHMVDNMRKKAAKRPESNIEPVIKTECRAEAASPEPEAIEEATPEPEAIEEATPEPEAIEEATPEVGTPEENRCRVCGCTNMQACPGGCYWVEDDLCSRCAKPVKVVDPEETMEFATVAEAMEYIKINYPLKEVLSGRVKMYREIKYTMDTSVTADEGG